MNEKDLSKMHYQRYCATLVKQDAVELEQELLRNLIRVKNFDRQGKNTLQMFLT